MSMMSDFDAMLKGVGSPRELIQLYQKYKVGDVINKQATPDHPYSAIYELQYCSGACNFVSSYFTGSTSFAAKAAMASTPTTQLAAGAGLTKPFQDSFNSKPTRIAYVYTTVGVSHEFILIKEGTAYALYQANVATEPKFTLAPSLNGGKDYNLHMDAGGFAGLLGQLTDKSQSNKIFPNNNDCDTYKALFGEF